MCLFCEIRAELERAGKGEVGITQPPMEATTSLEVEANRADIDAVNADSVLKLAKAAQILYSMNEGEALKRTIGLIKQLAPAQPEPELPPATAPAEDPGQDLPAELAEIARHLGVNPEDIQVVRFPKV